MIISLTYIVVSFFLSISGPLFSLTNMFADPRLLSNMFAFRIWFQRSSIIVQLHPAFQLAVQAVVYYVI